MIGNQQNTVTRKLIHKLFSIMLGYFQIASNSLHTLPYGYDFGVRPSAASQMAVATSFSVKNVESTDDITIISPPSMRAAIAELRAMYFSHIQSCSRRAHPART
jgi:hypothetical protein